jgi:toxin YoeB
MRSIESDPRSGIGKPQPLRHQLAGWWSRRIDREHRFVYRVEGERCTVLSCRFRYE